MISIFDIGIILILIMFLIVGIKRGVIKELVSFVGIIVVFILSFALKEKIGSILCTFLPFFKFTGNIKGLVVINIFLYQAISFLFVFSLLLGIYALSLKISKIIQKIVNLTIILWIPSKILGGLVSLLKGYLISFVIILFLMVPFGGSSLFHESTIVNFMLYKTPVVSKYASSFTNTFKEIYDLGLDVAKKEISVNDANLKSLDIMLKYKVVSKNTIETLVKLNKLDEVKGINKVLEKY